MDDGGYRRWRSSSPESIAKGYPEPIGRELPSGTLNVSFHRDDIGHRHLEGCRTHVSRGKRRRYGVFLIDDVFFYAGRCVRLWMSSSNWQTRVVRLMTVVDRGIGVADSSGFCWIVVEHRFDPDSESCTSIRMIRRNTGWISAEDFQRLRHGRISDKPRNTPMETETVNWTRKHLIGLEI